MPFFARALPGRAVTLPWRASAFSCHASRRLQSRKVRGGGGGGGGGRKSRWISGFRCRSHAGGGRILYEYHQRRA